MCHQSGILRDEYFLIAEEGEPENFQDSQGKELRAMRDEMYSLHKNHTYELTTLPQENIEESMGVQAEK